jgi:hypothetical protein
MKTLNSLLFTFLIAGFFLLSSCYKEVSEEFVGYWETELTELAVPNEVGGIEQLFHDTVFISLQISADKSASGNIGMATFTDVRVRKNPGDAESKGIAYIVKCGELGKLFPTDPVEKKRIEIMLKPIQGSTMGSEIDYYHGELFPYMLADPEFYRAD